jgi:hypothetical protein
MQTILLLAVFIASAPFVGGAPEDPLAPLRFLVGDWIAIDTPAGETGSFTFTLAVQDRVLVRTNEANYAATQERAASRHEDLLLIYSQDGSLKADYFDSEGHVIRYAVSAFTTSLPKAAGPAKQPRQPTGVLFLSDPNPREPRYILASDGVLGGSFEIAPTGSPESFKPYLSWKARRR